MSKPRKDDDRLAYNVVAIMGAEGRYPQVVIDEVIACDIDDLKAVLANLDECAEWLRRREAKG